MMRINLTLILLLATTIVFGQDSLIKVPLVQHHGYGPFSYGANALQFGDVPKDNPLYETVSSYQYKNIPNYLTQVEKGMIMLDPDQIINQAYLSHKISSGVYKELLSPDSSNSLRFYTKNKIASCLLFLKGKNREGREVLLLDCNNNGDFGDETPVEVEELVGPKYVDQKAKLLNHIRYELYDGNNIISKEIPIRILKSNGRYWYNFPRYGLTKLKVADSTYQIAVADFYNPAYPNVNLGLYTDKPIQDSAIVKKSEILSINNQQYKVVGVEAINDLLVLKKISKTILSSGQTGFNAPEIVGQDVTSLKPISLKKYLGKYVYLDFWGTWCAACIQQLPQLKQIYDLTSNEKLVFLGVAVNEKNIPLLKQKIKDNSIFWPNIVSERTSLIEKRYNIIAFPTGILIDPTGKIVYQDLNINKLKEVLSKLNLLK